MCYAHCINNHNLRDNFSKHVNNKNMSINVLSTYRHDHWYMISIRFLCSRNVPMFNTHTHTYTHTHTHTLKFYNQFCYAYLLSDSYDPCLSFRQAISQCQIDVVTVELWLKIRYTNSFGRQKSI